MKFRRVNPHNLRWLVPPWAIDPFVLAAELESLLSRYQRNRPRWDVPLGFWIQCSLEGERWLVEIKEPENDASLNHICGKLLLAADHWVIDVPLNEILKGAPELKGSHCVYFHTIETQEPLIYCGLTKQRWFDRYAQHENSARGGSPYLFHRAIREHAEKRIFHPKASQGHG